MGRFTHKRVLDNLIQIFDKDVYMLLIEGKDKAILLDTGNGVGNLKEYVDKLTDKPYEVWLTHSHFDHVDGVGWWDKAYLNAKDFDTFVAKTKEERLPRILERVYPDATVDELAPKFEGQLIPYKNGDIIDLGGTTLQVVEVSGHTPGCSMFLMIEDRIMIYGDAVGRKSGLWSTSTASDLVKSLKYLQTFDDKYDRIIRLHHGLWWQKGFADEVLECAENIVAGTDARQELPYNLFPNEVMYAAAECDLEDPEFPRKDGKTGNVFYFLRNAK